MEDVAVDHIDNLLAVSLKLSLDPSFVFKKTSDKLGVLRVLLNRIDCAASGAFARDEILESNREEVALIRVYGTALARENFLKEVDHVFISFRLLSNSCEEDFLFNLIGHKVKFL